MANDKHKTKATILNELESIKSLLVEEAGAEINDIPVLEDITVLDEAPVLDKVAVLDEIPVLDEVIDDEVPGEDPEPPILNLPEDDIPTITDEVEPTPEPVDLPALVSDSPPEEELSCQEPVIETAIDTAPDNPIETTEEFETPELEAEITEENLAEEQDLQKIREAYQAAISGNETEPSQDQAPGSAFDKTIDIEEKIAVSLAEEKTAQQPLVTELTESANGDNEPTSNTVDSQQSLFDQHAPEEQKAEQVAANASIEQKSESRAAAESAKTVKPQKNQPSSPIHQPENALPAAQQTAGENPFLPKHIRDRLQGSKPYPSSENTIITVESKHEESLEAHAERILEDVISEFLPRIEAELHIRLESVIKQHLIEREAQTEQDKIPDKV